ncbi:two-component system OmpR family sensor kinase [Paraburkholderia phenoliruptrix]|uniref:ATP-binding protein n=1 Tax=Paraburkholderia phenoliruptrix TaxID=252970 RepID=UPI00285B8345|nr:ATP-binding protein [Paraburkholderia phenoliruptrix]MDR6422084.1 two-component system OmpR family sensor kinase [Paraburkholderia phenoliruptrix]
MTSIRRWLLGWLICGLAAASAAAAFGIFRTAREEASELFDYELRTVALSLPTNFETAETVDRKGPEFEGISDDLILIEIWDKSGTLVYHSRQAPVLTRVPDGIHTIERNEVHWRVLALQQPDRFVQVAQPVSVRDALALRLALHTLWPLAVLMPVTIVLVLFVVGKGLAPIGGLSRLLGTRSLESLEPIHLDDKVPVEIRPLVDALNDLLQRLNVASRAQRTFIADAAHELRSPLTALKLQLQAAEKNGTLTGDGQTLERIDTRLNRLIRLVHQLLTLAHEDAESTSTAVVVSLRKIGEQAVGDFSLLADDKQIDLGLESRPPVTRDDACNVLADAHGVSVLLNNLVDNAIRYTPPGGKVDVVLTRNGDRFGFEVVDTGPGIPEEDLNRVLDRFYRGQHTKGTGSGLGLAIAARIAQRQQLRLSLRNNADGRGLSASVSGFVKAD